MTEKEALKLEIGKEYTFKVRQRKNKIKGKVLDNNTIFTGLSLYQGTQAIKIERRKGKYSSIWILSILNIEVVK